MGSWRAVNLSHYPRVVLYGRGCRYGAVIVEPLHVPHMQTDEILDEVKSLQLHIRGLPRRVREWGVYNAVDERVVNMSTVLPLVGFMYK